MRTHSDPETGENRYTIKVRVDLGTSVPRQMYDWLIDFDINCNAHLLWLYLYQYKITAGETHFVIEFIESRDAAHFKLVWSEYIV